MKPTIKDPAVYINMEVVADMLAAMPKDRLTTFVQILILPHPLYLLWIEKNYKDTSWGQAALNTTPGNDPRTIALTFFLADLPTERHYDNLPEPNP